MASPRDPQALEYLPNWGSQSCGHLASLSTFGTQFPCLGSGDATEIVLMGYTTCVRCEDAPQAPEWFPRQGAPLQGKKSPQVRLSHCQGAQAAGAVTALGEPGSSWGTRLFGVVPVTQPGLHYIRNKVGVSSHLPSWGGLLSVCSATAHSLPCGFWGGGFRGEGL